MTDKRIVMLRCLLNAPDIKKGITDAAVKSRSDANLIIEDYIKSTNVLLDIYEVCVENGYHGRGKKGLAEFIKGKIND